jgi:hypothetical protein
VKSRSVISAFAISLALLMSPGVGSAGPIDELLELLSQLPLLGQNVPNTSGPGTLQPTTAVDPACPSGSVCRGFEVSCPGIQAPARGFIATAKTSGSARGVLMTFNGGGGEAYEFADQVEADWLSQIRGDGFTTVQVRWVDPWLYASSGEDVGSHVLACRPATVIAWVHDTVFAPMNTPSLGAGRCGFCLTGNSGGGSQISYAISHYGLEGIIDGIFPTSGPPHAAMAKACKHVAGEAAYWFPAQRAELIDRARGFFHEDGPCLNHNASYASKWQQEGVDTGGNDYLHPATRVHIILGAEDEGYILAHGQDYGTRLKQAGSTMVTVQVIPGMGHSPSSQALAILRASLSN